MRSKHISTKNRCHFTAALAAITCALAILGVPSPHAWAGGFTVIQASVAPVIVIGTDLTISTMALDNGRIGQSYSETLEVANGTAPYSWSLEAGDLPAGLSLDSASGVISGTPTAYGRTNLVVRVTDSHVPPDAAYAPLAMKIEPLTLTVMTDTLPDGGMNVSYRQTLDAGGGGEPYTWSVSEGSLPAGLSLESTSGVICGTPTAVGAAAFTVQVVDSASPQVTAAKALSIAVALVPPMITTASLPRATVMVAYTKTLSASGGVTPYRWSIASGTLPTGLSLDSTTGVISGTPRAYGTAPVAYRVTDSQETPATATRALTLIVDSDTDNQGPTLTGGVLPSIVHIGIETSVTLTATADDSTRGNARIETVEYYIGTDPGLGRGTALTPADGAFDSPAEAASVAINATSWTADTRINVRAKDHIGNWSAGHVDVRATSDVTPPGRTVDLTAKPSGTFVKLTVGSHEFSSALPDTPVTKLFDGNTNSFWQTLGTTIPQEEYVALDLGAVRSAGALMLVPAAGGLCFPTDIKIEASEDGAGWETIAGLKPPRPAGMGYMWEFEPVEARYIKVSGPGVRYARDRHYYWRISEAQVFQTGWPMVQLQFTAPANDAYTGAKASLYDVRYSASEITAASFNACPQAPGLGAPKNPGAIEKSYVKIDSTADRVYVALKTGDDVGNWSTMSVVAQVDLEVSGFVSREPEDAAAGSATTRPTFVFRMDPTVTKAYISFSTCLPCVSKPLAGANGRVDKSIRFRLRPRVGTWTPTAAQWKAIKSIVNTDATLYWRLEGAMSKTLVTFGPARSIFFGTDKLAGLAVAGSHKLGSDDAIWPDKAAAPAFSWTCAAPGMKTFWIDVSTDPNMPLKDKRKTVVLGGKGITASPYTAKASEWLLMRRLAANGPLYWRVRARDAEKALTMASATKKLVLDGGTWTVSAVDLKAAAPSLTWTHAGPGIALYNLDVSATSGFASSVRTTLKIPASPSGAMTRAFTAGEVNAIKALAARNAGATTLYYRVRGVDADKAFAAYSDSATTPAP